MNRTVWCFLNLTFLLFLPFGLRDSCGSSVPSYLPVYGGPVYDAATSTGFLDVGYSPAAVSGFALAPVRKFVAGDNKGIRPMRWSNAGIVEELGILGTDPSGKVDAYVNAVNDSGLAVGFTDKYVGGSNLGSRAIRWNPDSTIAAELGTLGVSNIDGGGSAFAADVNASGLIVGGSARFVSGDYVGDYAVRWLPGFTQAIRLTGLSDNIALGYASSSAVAVNDSGLTVGTSQVNSLAGQLGARPVRWDAGTTLPTELGTLGADSSGGRYGSPIDVNNAGTIVGYSARFDGGVYRGQRAVRWAAGGTAAVELETLGEDANGVGLASASDINDGGTTVGVSRLYQGGLFLGNRAVRWAAGGTAAVELETLGTDPFGVTQSAANAIDANGVAVGYSHTFDGLVDLGPRAVAWRLDGSALDLNLLIDPASGWTLREATSISSTGWIAGHGDFDPDLGGPLTAYQRGFLLHVSNVPEPSAMTLAVLALYRTMAIRRRGGSRAFQ